MKYTRMKRLVYALLKEHAGEKELECIEIPSKIFTPCMNENAFWYLFYNEYKIYEELYNEGKIKTPKYLGEWIKDLI